MSRTGIIELGFNNVSLAQMESFGRLLESDMLLRATGRHKQHSAIQVHLTPIKHFGNLESAAVVVEIALSLAKRLEDFAITNVELINKLVCKI